MMRCVFIIRSGDSEKRLAERLGQESCLTGLTPYATLSISRLHRGEPTMGDVLKKELDCYEAHKAMLIGKSKGKYVLIKEDQIIDIFDTRIDAIRVGYEKYGNVPFLVKQILELDPPQNFTSNLLDV
jgi:hypothetical protein